MQHWISSALFLAVSSPFAAAQSIVFQDGFESGLQNWTASGLWNAELASDPCGALAAPFPEGSGAAWYGIPGNCNFDDGLPNGGSLMQNAWVTLPSNVASVSLYFKSWVDSEYCWGAWDVCEVRISAQGGPNSGFTTRLCDYNGPIAAQLPWHERRVDLSAYVGAQVRVTFVFFAGDNALNGGLGWLVDDVRIIAEPGQTACPSATFNNSCPCLPKFGVGGGCFNSLTKSATLISSGSASVSSDSLAFAAAEMPPGTAATLFQATAATAGPQAFGDGLLCVTGALLRLGTRFAPSGSVGWPVPNTITLSAAGFVDPSGGERFYQVIYRDAVPTFCTVATFNLTSAQRVVWAP
ncbi:MAG: hypothetical protein JNL28_16770 [Planctomycetes bacterium]|nr:hypothetical protein [Planctomycetota bacterium]